MNAPVIEPIANPITNPITNPIVNPIKILTTDDVTENNTIEIVDDAMNWDEENTQTMQTWITNSKEQQFIYEYSLDKIIKVSDRLQKTILILTAIQSLVTVTCVSVNAANYYYAVLSINIFLSIL